VTIDSFSHTTTGPFVLNKKPIKCHFNWAVAFTFYSTCHIVKEIKADAAAFQGMEFVHEKRESNHNAHVLARSTLFSSVGRHVWFFDPPDGVCNSYSAT